MREKILSMLLMIAIGLILVDVILRVSCCLVRGEASASSRHVWLVGSGSTFIYPQMEHWISLFTTYHPR